MKASLASLVAVALVASIAGVAAGRYLVPQVETERWQRGVVSADQPFLVWWGYPPVFFTSREAAEEFAQKNAAIGRPEDALTPQQCRELQQSGKALYPDVLRC